MDKPFRISGGFLLTAAFMLLTLPLQWILAAWIAAAFHELCHYAAIRMCAGKPQKMSVEVNTASISIPEMSRGKELLCAAAGPLGGFLLMILLPVCPRIALCGLFQSLYNLMPVYPMDGGRIICCLAAMTMKPTYAQWLCSFVQWVFVGVMVASALYAAIFMQVGLLPLILALVVLVKAKIINYPCKERLLALQ